MNYDTDIYTLIQSEDCYDLDIACVTNEGNNSVLSLYADGERESALYFERIVLKNDEIVQCVMPYLEENEEISDIKYVFSNTPCSFEIAIIKTSNDKEFIVPDSDGIDARDTMKNIMKPTLIKGTVYTKNEFVDIVQNYDFPKPMLLEEYLYGL